MSAAEFVRNVNPVYAADQKLWKVGDHYVVTSTVTGRDPETRVFAADAAGRITTWGDLPGSFAGQADHEGAIADYVDSIIEAAS